MKTKYILVLLAAIFLTSCQDIPSPDESFAGLTTVHFEGRELTTKTTFGEKDLETGLYHIYWSSGDQVGVTVNASAVFQPAIVIPSIDGRSSSFSATLDLPETPYKLQAVSPASAIVAFDGANRVTLNIPSSQTPEVLGPDPKAQILLAETAIEEVPTGTVPMQFHHATAYGCLNLVNLPTVAEVHSIDLIFDVPVSGKWKYNYSTQSFSSDVPANIITLHTDKTSNVFFACAPAALQGTTMLVRMNTEEGVYERSVTISAERSFKKGVISKLTVDMGSSSKKKSISLLAIGHSFAMNALWYVRDMLEELGYDDITIRIMYKGSCTLSMHVSYYNTDKGYEYSCDNYDGTWQMPKGTLLKDVLKERNWDYISMQQGPHESGNSSTFYPYLSQLIDIVRRDQQKAKLIWHLTWPDRRGYVPDMYSGDPDNMYDKIISVLHYDILATGSFGDVVPAGTAVQNLRTSFVGESVFSDSFHGYNKWGYYLTALTWARQLTGMTIVDLNSTPRGVQYSGKPSDYEYTLWEKRAVKESAENAWLSPYEPIPSTYITPVDPDPDPDSDPDPDPPAGTGTSSGEGIIWEND